MVVMPGAEPYIRRYSSTCRQNLAYTETFPDGYSVPHEANKRRNESYQYSVQMRCSLGLNYGRLFLEQVQTLVASLVGNSNWMTSYGSPLRKRIIHLLLATPRSPHFFRPSSPLIFFDQEAPSTQQPEQGTSAVEEWQLSSSTKFNILKVCFTVRL